MSHNIVFLPPYVKAIAERIGTIYEGANDLLMTFEMATYELSRLLDQIGDLEADLSELFEARERSSHSTAS
jgi:hypothetical protein